MNEINNLGNVDSFTYEYFISKEKDRQNNNIELIASENFPSRRVLNAAGSILTNKYAEGYSGKRYYGGCKWIDCIETKTINDVCKLFNCKFANVQPHCGSSANQAVYRTFCKPGDTILGMDLSAGGHLTHGHKMSFSGQDYNVVSYGVDENGILDYEDLRKKLAAYNPRMLIVGASSYSQKIDYKRIKDILDEHNNMLRDIIEQRGKYSIDTNNVTKKQYEKFKCYYMVDMAHVAGLVAGGVHPSPIPYADVVTSTTHKTLRGPRGGLILWNNDEYTKQINSSVFPGIQGGPLEHIIAAKGICFEEAMTTEFKEYTKQVILNAKVFAKTFIDLGYKVISNGTENHMFILDTYSSIGLTGKEVETALDVINITVNKNQIPNDTLPPLKSSGVRIGVAAMTTKKWKEAHFKALAYLITGYLKQVKNNLSNDLCIQEYKEKVKQLIDAVNTGKIINNIDYVSTKKKVSNIDSITLEEKYKLLLFMIIRNDGVMETGLKLGKSLSEIDDMSYRTIQAMLSSMDYNIDNIRDTYNECEKNNKKINKEDKINGKN